MGKQLAKKVRPNLHQKPRFGSSSGESVRIHSRLIDARWLMAAEPKRLSAWLCGRAGPSLTNFHPHAVSCSNDLVVAYRIDSVFGTHGWNGGTSFNPFESTHEAGGAEQLLRLLYIQTRNSRSSEHIIDGVPRASTHHVMCAPPQEKHEGGLSCLRVNRQTGKRAQRSRCLTPEF